MTGRRPALLILVAALLSVTVSVRSEPANKAPEPAKDAPQTPKDAPIARKDRHALLVAVTFYEKLSESKHLKGPANDSDLVYKMLVEKLQFSPDQIRVLSEKEGKAKGKDFLPTKANIKREFDRLATVAKAGEQVFIHLGGHGSQQPEPPGEPDPKPDGLDVTFLPRDVGKWNDKVGSVENAIVGHEMGKWLKPISDTKASIWITFDSCHSGTMMRGNEVTRDVKMSEDLGIPPEVLEKTRKDAAAREAKKPERSRGGDEPPAYKLAKQGGMVAIYAAQNSEVTLEREMPPMTENGTVHGLLTYTIVMVMTEAFEHSKQPITYAELARRIQGQYVAWGRSFPTPLIEGINSDLEILGDKEWKGRSSILLSTKDDLKINAGAIHGLTRGSILSVTPPSGKGDKRLGFVRITELRNVDSEVEACDENGKEAKTEFPDGSVSQKFFTDLGDQKLKVAIAPLDYKGKAVPEAVRKTLSEALKKLDGPESVVQSVEKPEKADWLMQVWGPDGNQVALVPAKAALTSKQLEETPAFAPTPIDDKLGIKLRESLERIGRAENLKRLAASGAEVAGVDRGVKVKIEIARKKDATDRVGTYPIAWPGPCFSVYNKDRLAMRISNPGKVPIDVTVLYIDSGYGIKCLYPKDKQLNRLRPGDSEIAEFLAGGKTPGPEQFVVLAVKGKGQPVDFSSLTQPTLDAAARGLKDDVLPLDKALDSPLGKLLKKGLYGQGSTRGMAVDEVDDHVMMLIPMQYKKERRPEVPKPEPKTEK